MGEKFAITASASSSSDTRESEVVDNFGATSATACRPLRRSGEGVTVEEAATPPHPIGSGAGGCVVEAGDVEAGEAGREGTDLGNVLIAVVDRDKLCVITTSHMVVK